jgi:ABC-2 type transport system ATP-binding protein
MDDILDAHALTKRYRRTTVLRDVSIEIEAGAIHGLLGPNGAGKTTCLHLVTGLLEADGGGVLIGGADVAVPASRRLFGFAPDDLPLPGALTGREYLALHDALRERDDRARAAELADLLRIADALDRPVGDYSHGMRRKLQLVAAVMHDPLLLVLDEPFRGLDPESAVALRALVIAFARAGRAVLIATHDLLRAERDCTAVTILDHGSVVASGSPARLLADHPHARTLDDVFLAVTGRAAEAEHRLARLDAVFDHLPDRTRFLSETTP